MPIYNKKKARVFRLPPEQVVAKRQLGGRGRGDSALRHQETSLGRSAYERVKDDTDFSEVGPERLEVTPGGDDGKTPGSMGLGASLAEPGTARSDLEPPPQPARVRRGDSLTWEFDVKCRLFFELSCQFSQTRLTWHCRRGGECEGIQSYEGLYLGLLL